MGRFDIDLLKLLECGGICFGVESDIPESMPETDSLECKGFVEPFSCSHLHDYDNFSCPNRNPDPSSNDRDDWSAWCYHHRVAGRPTF